MAASKGLHFEQTYCPGCHECRELYLVLGDLSCSDAADALLDAPPEVRLPEVVQPHAPGTSRGSADGNKQARQAEGLRLTNDCP
jgi:hypothetical protein